MAVTRVTVHHEGAGTPSDTARGADGGYTYWVGPTRWQRLRTVVTSFATKHYNHVSVDICLSGDRTNIPVTDAEIRMIGECVADARARGEVVDHPLVYPHRESFSTACPGDKTMERFPAIAAVCQVFEAPPIDWAAIARLEHWRLRLHAKALEYGDRSRDVQIMQDLLRAKKYLRFAAGNAFGIRARRAVHRFKLGHPEIGNTDGRKFGGDAADALLKP